MKTTCRIALSAFCLAASLRAAAELTVDCDIPAGNVVVDSIKGAVVKVRQDLRDTKGNWFYWAFRVKGAAGRTVEFVFTDKSGGGPVGVRGPVVSTDGGKTFAYPLDGKSKSDGFTYTFGADENETLFYECHPYVRANWDAFVARHAADIAAGKMKIEEHCKSRKGAVVPRMRYGCISGKPKYRFLVTCRHHCSESLASWVVEGIADAFMADDDLGKWLCENVEVMCVPMMDYDGVQAGDQGKNRKPHDHNHDYSEFLYPETFALTKWVMGHAGGQLDAFLDIHCPWVRGKYNEFVYTPLKNPKLYPITEGLFSSLVEKHQEGGLRYKASDDLAYGVAWNKGGAFSNGWSSSSWVVHSVKGLKVCRAIEVPFANANGAVVTPEKCRLYGHGLARALRELMLETGKDGAAESKWRGIDRDFLVKLLSIKSVTSDIAKVNEAVDFVKEYLAARGIACAVEADAEGRKSLYASTKPGKVQDYLLVVHLDVVPGEPALFVPRFEGNKIIARGSQDCKGNAAVAARLLELLNGRASLGVVFAGDEETGGLTTKMMVERGYAAKKLVIVFDSATDGAYYAQKGNFYVQARAIGKGGHSSRPWLSDNPIEKLIEGCARVKAAWPEPTEDRWCNVIVPTIVNAGDAGNRIPDYADVWYNLRFIDEDAPERLCRVLKEKGGFEIVKTRCTGGPMLMDRNAPEVVRFIEARRAMWPERNPKLDKMLAMTDARHYANCGVPVLVSGSCGGEPHSPDEWNDIVSMDDNVEMLEKFFAESK